MSGVYIKGMEMPKAPGIYRIEFDSCGNPYLLSDNGDLGLWHLVPVPDHGRLGDLDKLESGLRLCAKYQTGYRQQGILGCCETIRTFPTVIPADQEGEKQYEI